MEVWGTPVIADVEDIIDLLRTEIRIQEIDLLKHMKPTFQNVMVTCIAHGDGTEKKPSLGISTVDVFRNGKTYKAGTCNCFTCGYTADLAEFISNAFGYQDKGMFGYKWITTNFVNLSVEKRRPLKLDMSRDIETESKDEFISEETLQKFRVIHPYMYERKLSDKVISYFDVGYDEETDALTFPVKDLSGNVPLIQRRSVSFKQFQNDEGAYRGNYVYGLYEVIKNISWIKEVIVCESPIDALTCWVHKVPAVAIFGSSITATQISLLRHLTIRKFISGFDNDKAGDEGSEKLKKHLGDIKIIHRLQFPEELNDCGEYVNDINAMTENQFLSRKSSILKN